MSSQRPRILVVDDTPANLMMLANALESEFAFQLVTSGPAALAMAAKLPPELILLDIMMPGMDGYETCRQFKANPQLAHIPIVFVTALGDNNAQLKGLELGAADYLLKPINIDIARQRIRNLLEREHLRRAIEAHRNSLEEVVAARTAELLTARDAAETASHSKSIFLANVSHELRTPLNIILGMNDQVLRKVGDEALRRQSEQVRDAARHLLGLVDGLLLVARADDDQASAQTEAFSVGRLVAVVEHEFMSQAAAKGLSLRHEIDPRLPETLGGSAPRLRQILQNFLSNAVKFSERGTITTRVVLEEMQGEQFVVAFEVADEGIGIPENQLKAIFDSFTQVDPALNRKYGGVGIGLAINKYLADKLGGQIAVASSEGKGSRFSVKLTLGTAARLAALEFAPAAAGAEPPAMPAASASQLLADGDREARQQALARLSTALAGDDFASIELWESAESLISPLLGADLPKFRQALGQFAFEEAHRLLRTATPC